MIKIFHRFFYAWIFLTKLPAPPLPKAKNEDWGRIAPYFVLVGFILGFVIFCFAKILMFLKLAFMFSSLLVLLVWVIGTGGLHLDGLMDTFDGIGCQENEKKIEAMRDSRIGAFGAMAGIFVILFKLVSLCAIVLNKLFFVILFAVPLARLAVVYSFTFLSRSKDSGISSSLLVSGLKKPNDFIFNVLSFVFIFLVLLFLFKLNINYCIFVLASFILSILWSYWLHNQFKGHFGDTYGALIELSEVTALSLGVVLKHYLL